MTIKTRLECRGAEFERRQPNGTSIVQAKQGLEARIAFDPLDEITLSASERPSRQLLPQVGRLRTRLNRNPSWVRSSRGFFSMMGACPMNSKTSLRRTAPEASFR
jgi:hypothetical protein